MREEEALRVLFASEYGALRDHIRAVLENGEERSWEHEIQTPSGPRMVLHRRTRIDEASSQIELLSPFDRMERSDYAKRMDGLSLFLRGARRIVRLLGAFCGMAALLYALAVVLLGFWTTGGETAQSTGSDELPEPGRVNIAVCGGGAHTDFVLPGRVVYADGTERNWTALFPPPARYARVPGLALFVGWGQKDFFMQVPSWAELRPGIALRALAGGPSALRVIYGAADMAKDPECRELTLSDAQYRTLAAYIESELARDAAGKPVSVPGGLYGDQVAFYEGKSRFSAFATCNTWTAEALKAAGLRAPVWTPLEYFVMRALPEGR